MDDDKENSISYYIQRLQSLLAKIIAESDEFQELKNLIQQEDEDLQLCVFSVLMDKKNMDAMKNLDLSALQKWIEQGGKGILGGDDEIWSASDKEFLKAIRISI